MENNFNFINDCSDNCIIKTEKYFSSKGFIITSISKISGLDNKTYGDLKLTLYKDGVYKDVYVDYKKQTRDRWYIPIELVQVNAKGDYSSWLYNDNINYCIYEFKDGRVFLFEHYELIKIAKQNNTDDMWNTCIVYSKSPKNYASERNYIDEKLNSYRIIKDDNNIKADHINGCYNTLYGEKTHSGFCMNLDLVSVSDHKI